MADSYAFIGGSLNGCALNACAINNILRADFTIDANGNSVTSGTALAYSYHYQYPAGSALISGLIAGAYGQLAVVGGYSSLSLFTTPSCWGHAEYPDGVLLSTGSASAYGKFMVQIMHTLRTAVVAGYGTEVGVEELNTNVTILKTEDREALVAYNPSFYEVD